MLKYSISILYFIGSLCYLLDLLMYHNISLGTLVTRFFMAETVTQFEHGWQPSLVYCSYSVLLQPVVPTLIYSCCCGLVAEFGIVIQTSSVLVFFTMLTRYSGWDLYFLKKILLVHVQTYWTCSSQHCH